jgi:sodium/bile acid cotransporter 7
LTSPLAFIKRNGYVFSLVGAALLGLAFPGPGSRDGVLHLSVITQIGIMLVFFLHGANLAPKNLRQGIANWRLHLMIQLSTFVMFPLIGAALLFGGAGYLPTDILLGLFYLCALPSTITSSVAMTALARGNVPGAIFNATLSGLIGMVMTPLLMSLVMQTTGRSLPLLPSILSVMGTLLLPFVLGQLFRSFLIGFITRHKPLIGLIDRGVIVLIVLASFSESSKANIWTTYPVTSLLLLLALTAVLLTIVLWLTTTVSRLLGFSVDDEIAAVFCGSKKSLANGMPMANVLLAGQAGLGVMVLPMMIYHQLQLLVCSVMAQRYARRHQVDATVETPVLQQR